MSTVAKVAQVAKKAFNPYLRPQDYATKGPQTSVPKEMVIGATLGLIAGLSWKIQHWNQRRKVENYYYLQDKLKAEE